MTSYDAYIWAGFGPILILFVFAVLIYVLYIGYILYNILVKHNKHEHERERGLVKFVLYSLFEEYNGTLYIQNRIVNPSIIRLLVLYVFNISALALAVAWDILLLEKTHICETGLDCFTDENGQPIQNCSALYETASSDHSDAISNISNTTNSYIITVNSIPSITCFRFASNYATAAASIGGLFAFGRGMMSILAFANIWIYDAIAARCRPRCAVLNMVILQLGLTLFVTALLIVVVLVEEVQSKTFRSLRPTIQFISLVVTVLVALLVPWYSLPENVKNQKYDKDDETKEMTNTTDYSRLIE